MKAERSVDGPQEEPLDKQVQQVLTEARMVLPGIQALFGFQLVAVFNNSFSEKLNHGQRCVHLAALAMVAVSTALVMTPAAYHRLVEPGRVSRSLVRIGTWCLSLGMLPLLVAISADFYLIARIIVVDVAWSVASAALVALGFVGLWYGFPLAIRYKRR